MSKVIKAMDARKGEVKTADVESRQTVIKEGQG